MVTQTIRLKEQLVSVRTYIRNQNLLDSKDLGEVRVALLAVQNDGETYCEELYKCEKAYSVDENQNAVSCIVYTKVNIAD